MGTPLAQDKPARPLAAQNCQVPTSLGAEPSIRTTTVAQQYGIWKVDAIKAIMTNLE